MRISTWKLVQKKGAKGAWTGRVRFKLDGKWRQREKRLRTYLDHDGDERAVKTRRHAERALQQWVSELESDASLGSSKARLLDYANHYVDSREGELEPRTADAYRSMVRTHFTADGIGGVRLCDLTTSVVQQWVDGLVASGLARSTVRKTYGFLSTVCRAATRGDHPALMRNPCDGSIAGLRMRVGERRRPQGLDKADYWALVGELEGMCSKRPVAVAALVALMAGLRQGEVCALRWRDWRDGMLHVRHSVSRPVGAGLRVKAPKTAAGVRDVPVMPRLAEALDARRREQERQLREAGVELTGAEFDALFIVGDVDGEPRNPTAISGSWRGLATRRGYVGTLGRRLRFHDLRDAFASMMLAEGVDVGTVATVLGHERPSTTLDHYTAFLPSASTRAFAALGSSAGDGE